MSNKQEGQNFLQGTAILAMATALVKIMGAVYKIPLNAIIGEQGFGYFNTAYEIYNVLLMISTAGLPVAMSRMISQANSLENYNQVRRIRNFCNIRHFPILPPLLVLKIPWEKYINFPRLEPDQCILLHFLNDAHILPLPQDSPRPIFL